MYNNFSKVMLFLSEYCHVILALGVKEWDYQHHVLSVFLFLLALVSCVVALMADKLVEEKIQVEQKPKVALMSSVTKNNSMRYVFSGLLALFLLVLVLNFHFVWSWVLLGVIFVVLFALQISSENRLVPFNPFLYFKGYRLYNTSVRDGNAIKNTLLLSKKDRTKVTMLTTGNPEISADGYIENSGAYIIEV